MRTISPVFLVALIACGGGGGDLAGSASATVLSPPDGVVTDAELVTVRGTTPGAAAVRVAGIAATSSDGFLTWRAQVPLGRGTNRIFVETEDGDGNVDARAASVTVERQEVLTNADSIAVDAANGRLLCALSSSDSRRSIVAIDLATAQSSILSGPSNGAGPAFEAPELITVDGAASRALVYDGDLRALLSVDLPTGDRALVSDAAMGTGSDFTWVSDMIIDASRNRAIMIDGTRLISIDLSNGNRAHFTDDLDNPRRLTLDAANDRVLVLDDSGIVACDLATTSLTPISTDTRGAGPELRFPTDIEFVAADNSALVSLSGDAVLRVDLATGDRALFSDEATGLGLAFTGPRDLALDPSRGRVLVSDQDDGRDGILAVDLATGNRSVFFESARGSGPFFDDPRDVTVDLARNRLLVSDGGSGGRHILAIDLRTGDRTVLAPWTTGNSEGLVVEPGRDRILLVDNTDAIFAMDPVSGVRSVLSDASTGTGPLFETMQDIVVDAANDRALVVDSGLDALLAVDLGSGDRTVISDAARGTGPAIASPQDLALDAAHNRVLVLDANLEAVLAIDLGSGNRTIVSGPAVGSGPDIIGNEGICFEPDRNRLLVIGRRTLMAIDVSTGNRTIVSDPDTGAGPVMGSTLEDVVVLPGNVALVIDDANPNYLHAVDLETGDRFIHSK